MEPEESGRSARLKRDTKPKRLPKITGYWVGSGRTWLCGPQKPRLIRASQTSVLRLCEGPGFLPNATIQLRYNVVPAELPEYFNGDDLVQVGQPRSTFLHGIYIWAALEGLLGLSPHPDVLHVNPALPTGWDWIAVSHLPYRGFPLSLFADRQTKTLFTTFRVVTSWNQVEVPERLQQQYSFQSEQNAFWMVVPVKNGNEVFVASDQAVQGKLVERKTGRVVAEMSLPAGGTVRKKLE